MTETTAGSLMKTQNNEPTIEVKIAGDYTAPDRMTKEQLLQYISDHYNDPIWIFTLGQGMVQPAQLAEADFATLGAIRITPGLVGVMRKEEEE